MEYRRICCMLALFACTTILLSAQETPIPKYHPVTFALNLDNMHLWRGYEVTRMPITNLTAAYHTKNDMFTIGIWGGVGFTGLYREFDYFAQFKIKGLTLAVWDIWNFSPEYSWGVRPQIFDYKAKSTGHFIDVSLAYTLPIEKFPLSMYWATIVYGRDRQVLNGDIGNQRSGKNQYSTYVELGYPVWQFQGYKFGIQLAGVFALLKGENLGNFYTQKNGFNIVNAGFNISKIFDFSGKYKLPVSVLAMWNPANNNGNVQVSLGILSF